MVRYSPVHRGPLPHDVTETFRSGSYTGVLLSTPITLYRVYSDPERRLGNYWMITPPRGPLSALIGSAILPQWGNTATHVVTVRVPPGQTIYHGAAAAQGRLVGGDSQVYLPRVDPRWIQGEIKYRRSADRSPPR